MDLNEIIAALLELPNLIYATEQASNDIRHTLKQAKADLEERQNTIALSRDAKTWGSNEAERSLNKAQAFANDALCRRLNGSIVSLENELMENDALLTKHKNLFYAYRSVAELETATLLANRSVGSAANGVVIAENLGL
ncbi:MAG: hypothetical protein KDE53_04665 [Caldilineaceae bacterium]|nr:hypothetical protein [Caldilineaceae bacterium]